MKYRNSTHILPIHLLKAYLTISIKIINDLVSVGRKFFTINSLFLEQLDTLYPYVMIYSESCQVVFDTNYGAKPFVLIKEVR
jgi:hypothetical protein